MTKEEQVNPVFRPNGISYLEIPALDVIMSAEFYRSGFGWKIRKDPTSTSFEDGSGHVIGHWVTDRPVARDSRVVPYIYVVSVDATLEKISALGGEIVKTPYKEGNLKVATFRDPSGNLLGIWQRS